MLLTIFDFLDHPAENMMRAFPCVMRTLSTVEKSSSRYSFASTDPVKTINSMTAINSPLHLPVRTVDSARSFIRPGTSVIILNVKIRLGLASIFYEDKNGQEANGSQLHLDAPSSAAAFLIFFRLYELLLSFGDMLHGHVYVVVYPVYNFPLVLNHAQDVLHQVVDVRHVFRQFVDFLVVVLSFSLELVLLEQR